MPPSNNRPKVPTVYVPDPSNPNKSTPVSKERIPFVQVPSAQIVKPDGQVDGESLSRILTQIQQNVHDATISQRSSPLNNFVVVKGVTLLKGIPTVVRHNLGTAFSHYDCKRIYSKYTDASGNQQDSFPYQGQETHNNANASGVQMDPTVYLVLIQPVSGRYDIAVYT